MLAAAPHAAADIALHVSGEIDEHWGWHLVHSAAEGGSVEIIDVLLAAAPEQASAVTDWGHTPLHVAAGGGQLEAAWCLLQAAPATAAVADEDGLLPLHWAAISRGPAAAAVIELLPAAGAPGLDATTVMGYLPLHLAARHGNVAAVALLLEAAPTATLRQSNAGRRPLHVALRCGCIDAARLLLPATGLSADQLLDAQAAAVPSWFPVDPSLRQPIYADVAARTPLTPAQWVRVPAPCAGLGAALPAVLARSTAEARLLVAHLPAEEQRRLRTGALALARRQRSLHLALPTPLAERILALSCAG